MNRIIFDLENDGLLAETTKVHCVAALDVDTGQQVGVWGPAEIPAALEVLDKADVLVGHNIQKHDLPVLEKLHGFRPRRYPALIDTLVCSRVIYPNLRDTDSDLVEAGRLPAIFHGHHSLEAWGYRLGNKKAEYDGGWSEWSQEMQDYMVQDTRANLTLWKYLNPDAYSPRAIELEHRCALVCDEIETEGVPFNVPAAEALLATLQQRADQAEERLKEQFGGWFAAAGTFIPKASRGKYLAGPQLFCELGADGKLCDICAQRQATKRGDATPVVHGQCTKIKWVEFNPGSRDHIARVCMKRGWKPSKFTDAGRPQIDEQVVAEIVARFPEMEELGTYLLVQKRVSQLATGQQAWLKAVQADGRIHGAINPMGTTTSRGAHMRPNLGQVPAAASPYGLECRALFHV